VVWCERMRHKGRCFFSEDTAGYRLESQSRWCGKEGIHLSCTFSRWSSRGAHVAGVSSVCVN